MSVRLSTRALAHPGHSRGRENGRATAVVHVGGLHYASEKAVVERVIAEAIVRGATVVVSIIGSYDATQKGGGKRASMKGFRVEIDRLGVSAVGAYTAETMSAADLATFAGAGDASARVAVRGRLR